MKLYRQVSTSERIPEKDGSYITDTGFNYIINRKWTDHDDFVDPLWWLEEIELPSNSQIDWQYPLTDGAVHKTTLNVGCRQGAKWIISLIKG